MRKNSKIFKFLIPGVISIILIVTIFIGTKFLPKQALGSIYNIDEAGTNFDNIQRGDTVNYEINGYSDWQVISKDDYNGTVDVVPKTNVEDLTLEYGHPKEYYEQKFQETANKYTDNNYVISARTVNSGDLDFFSYRYDDDFWLSNIDDMKITTSQAMYQYGGPEPYKMYILPSKENYSSNGFTENVGDIINYSAYGVNRWVIYKKDGQNKIYIMPATPIEITIEGLNDNIYSRMMDLYRNQPYYSISYGDYENVPNLIPDFLNQQTEGIYLWRYIDWQSYKKVGNTISYVPYYSNRLYLYENGEYMDVKNARTIYVDKEPYTLGYRPVVSLKVKKEVEDKNKKEISDSLQVGDYVNYEANGYKNWKVLSIDKKLGTVDIISGGIVKNITLSGKEDWDNYEMIIQQEVDQYKNDNNVISATTVNSSQINLLKEIDKSILSRYWTLSKDIYIERNTSFNGYYNKTVLNHGITTIDLYKYENNEMKLENIILYMVEEDTGNGVDEGLNYSYTAGIRPVIRLKLNDVEKASDKETKIIVNETEKVEKIYIKEQETSNSNYNGPAITDEYTSINDTSNADINHNNTNKNEIKNSEKVKCTPKEKIVEKIVYNDKWFYKYGFFILLIPCIVEAILLIVRMKSKN